MAAAVAAGGNLPAGAVGKPHASGGTLYVLHGVPVLLRSGTKLGERNGSRHCNQTGAGLVHWYNGVFDAIVLGVSGAAANTPSGMAAAVPAITKAVQACYPTRQGGAGGPQSVGSYISYYNGQRAGLGGNGLQVANPTKAKPQAPVAPQAPAPVATTGKATKVSKATQPAV